MKEWKPSMTGYLMGRGVEKEQAEMFALQLAGYDMNVVAAIKHVGIREVQAANRRVRNILATTFPLSRRCRRCQTRDKCQTHRQGFPEGLAAICDMYKSEKEIGV